MSTLRSFLAAILLTLLGALAVARVEAQNAQAANAAAGEKTLRVTVLGPGGSPLPKASVTVPLELTVENGSNAWHRFTGADGTTEFRLGSAIKRSTFSITVTHTNYAARQVYWFDGKESIELPTQYTFQLERGVTLAGTVHDSRGEPVAGAEIRLLSLGGRMASLPRSANEQSTFLPEQGRLLTDASGAWRALNFPKEATGVRCEVLTPNGARFVFSTDGRLAQTEGAEPLDFTALQAGNALLVLREGRTIRGIVVDEAGQAITGARVLERAGATFQRPFFAFTNGPDGRFELKHRREIEHLLTASAPGYAMGSAIASAERDAPEVRIVLRPAKPLRLRLVDEQGQPLAGANISVVDHRSRNHVVDWSTESDSTGRVVWTNAPADPTVFLVSAANYPVRTIVLSPAGEEQVVRMRRGAEDQVNVRVRAIDAESGTVLAAFDVLREIQWNNAFMEWARGVDGVATGVVRMAELQNGIGSVYRLRVQAIGFKPWTSEQIYLSDGDQEIEVRLQKAPQPRGVVLTPEGLKASDARVYLQTEKGSLFQNTPGQFHLSNGGQMVRTDPEGRFDFAVANDENRLTVLHATGFASLTVAELRAASQQVRLQPYGRIEGVVTLAGAPREGVRVAARSPIGWDGNIRHHIILNASTDGEGRFVFTNLIPGDYVLYRMPHVISYHTTTESHRWPLEVKAGETAEVNYAFQGRTVVGAVDAGSPVDWKWNPHLLVRKQAVPPNEPSFGAYVTPERYQKAREEFGRRPDVVAHRRALQQFQLVFDNNGNFRAEDVPPGKYELRIRVTKKTAGERFRNEGAEVEIGALITDVEIPAGPADQEFDLGTFELPGGGPVAEGEAVAFPALGLDDKLLDLASLQGRPVVLVFWATWARGFEERLQQLQQAQATSGKLAQFVSINLDDPPEVIREHTEGLPGEWIHARLESGNRYDVTERLVINTLPNVLVLDASGRVAGRELEPQRLEKFVQRMVRKTAGK
jgi:hypothetical protein